MNRPWQIFVGFDPREAAAFAVSRHSIDRLKTVPVPVRGVVLDDLIEQGLYRRPTEYRFNSEGRRQIWDVISDAPCSTEFSIARFLVPHLAGGGLALFVDGDVLARGNIVRLFDQAERESFAVWCVKHKHEPTTEIKMDGQVQTVYPRKNWSSVAMFDVDHVANRSLTVDLVNTAPGRDLHRFCWLDDCDIGEFDPKWNWLAGESDPAIDPSIVHYTMGPPCMPGYEKAPYAQEWHQALRDWAK